MYNLRVKNQKKKLIYILTILFILVMIYGEYRTNIAHNFYHYAHSIHKTDNKYYYGFSVKPVTEGWYTIHNKKIYCDADGKAANGIYNIDNTKYCFQNGNTATGWQTVNNDKYYFNIIGKAAEGLQRINNNLYFFDNACKMCKGWVSVQNKKYFFDENGIGVKGFQKIGKDKYYFNESGVMETGYIHVDGKNYLLSKDGKIQTGIQKINHTTKCFGDDGAELKNEWYIKDNLKYYFDENGNAVNSWQNINDQQYYFKDNHLVTGLQEIDGNHYWFDENGIMQTGYVHDGDVTRYFTEDGTLLTNSDIDEYHAGEDGELEWRISPKGDPQNVSNDSPSFDFSGTIGDSGRLYIPDVGVSVAVYYAYPDDDAQAITDRGDSAANLVGWQMPLIADHKNQGFSAINDCVPGETIAYIGYGGDDYSTYICTDSLIGYNSGEDLYDSNGVSIGDYYPGSFLAYTCLDNWHNVRVVIFSEI